MDDDWEIQMRHKLELAAFKVKRTCCKGSFFTKNIQKENCFINIDVAKGRL